MCESERYPPNDIHCPARFKLPERVDQQESRAFAGCLQMSAHRFVAAAQHGQESGVLFEVALRGVGHLSRSMQHAVLRVVARSAGATVDIKRVPETVPVEIAGPAHYKLDQAAPIATVDDLPGYDAIIVGTPTRYGRMPGIDPDRLVLLATLAYAGCMVALALVRNLYVLYAVSLINGFAWISVLSSLQIAAQTSVPAWVRARALSLYIVVFSAGMAIGSLLWGTLAQPAVNGVRADRSGGRHRAGCLGQQALSPGRCGHPQRHALRALAATGPRR
jgi:hypothetical protein